MLGSAPLALLSEFLEFHEGLLYFNVLFMLNSFSHALLDLSLLLLSLDVLANLVVVDVAAPLLSH